MSNKKRALGRGLSALLEASETDITTRLGTNDQLKVVGTVSNIELSQIETNPFQPRTKIEQETLIELVSSIKELGIIQPVTVRKLGYGRYQLISGERRYKAAQLAGLNEIPAYIRIANDQSMLEMALVENIQRENLNAIEIAISYQRLIEECQITQEALSKKVGKKRSTITNYLRLLKLPAEIQLGIKEKKITMGHARALINIDDTDIQLAIFQQIIDEDLSVRQVEKIVQNEAKPKKTPPQKTSHTLPFEHQKLQDNLSHQLNTEVILHRNTNGTGKIVIPFSSDGDLEQIVEKLDI